MRMGKGREEGGEERVPECQRRRDAPALALSPSASSCAGMSRKCWPLPESRGVVDSWLLVLVKDDSVEQPLALIEPPPALLLLLLLDRETRNQVNGSPPPPRLAALIPPISCRGRLVDSLMLLAGLLLSRAMPPQPTATLCPGRCMPTCQHATKQPGCQMAHAHAHAHQRRVAPERLPPACRHGLTSSSSSSQPCPAPLQSLTPAPQTRRAMSAAISLPGTTYYSINRGTTHYSTNRMQHAHRDAVHVAMC